MDKSPMFSFSLGILITLATLATPARAESVTTVNRTTHQQKPLANASVQFPLSTHEQWIVDASGARVKLKGVNWYGASDGYNVVGGLDKNTLHNIVGLIRELGFNSVRLPFSNAMLHAHAVAQEAVTANPQFVGKAPIAVFDAVVQELTDQGLIVILNNHTTSAVWCCGWDDNALWFSNNFTVDQWMEDWEALAARYIHNPRVIGADLRNEVRWGPEGGAEWGSGTDRDWRIAAQNLGNRLLNINPDLLIIVEGVSYATDFSHVTAAPLALHESNKIVYSSHSYSWFRGGDEKNIPYSSVKDGLDHGWGFLNAGTAGLKAPIWIGEFGAGPTDDPTWFTYFVRYIHDNDLDWCIWPLNVGPTAGGMNEQWGLVTADWQRPLADWRVELLKTIQ